MDPVAGNWAPIYYEMTGSQFLEIRVSSGCIDIAKILFKLQRSQRY